MSEDKITAAELKRMTAALPEAMLWGGQLYPHELREILMAMGYFELLEALQWVEQQGWLRYTKRLPKQNAEFCDGVDKALAAIAKALGD